MWNKGFILSLLANFTYWICFFFHIALYPLYLDRQGLDSTTLSNVLAVGAFGALIGRIVSGWAIDQWGAKPFIAFGGTSMAILSPLMVLTNNLTLLYALRIVFGFGVGIFTNATLAHVTYISPPESRGRAVSWWGVMNNIANAIIPPIAVALLLISSFPAAFTFGAVFALAAGMIGIILPRAGSKPTSNPAGNFHAPMLPITEDGEPLPPIRSGFRILVRPAVFPGIVAGAVGFALAAFISFAPLIAEQSGMENPGLYLTVFAIANIIGQFTSGLVSDRMGRPWVILPGFVLAALAMGVQGVAPQAGLLIPFVFGLGTGSVVPGILAWAVDLVKAEEQALASSTVLVMWEIFVFVGIAFQGRMMDAGQGAAGFQTMAGLITVSMALYVLYRWHTRRRPIPQAIITMRDSHPSPALWPRLHSQPGPLIPLFNIRLDSLENPRTGEVFQRLVLETPDWVNIVALTPEGRVVMVRQFRFGVGRITTEIPGGIVDPGETSGEAARRELLEETGYSSDDWVYLGAVEANPAIQNNLCHHWLALNVTKNGQVNFGDGEDITAMEMTLGEIKNEIQEGRLLHSLALSGLARVFDLWKE